MENRAKKEQIENEYAAHSYRTFDKSKIPIVPKAQQIKITEKSMSSNSITSSNNLQNGTNKDKSTTYLDQSILYVKDMDNNWTLCKYQDIPDWLQDNQYIIFGYRPPLPSFSACFKSIFRMHTETVNIWTHLIGCVIFILLAIKFFLNQPKLEERLAFSSYFIGAIMCLGGSTLYHTFTCHSQAVSKLVNRFDYCGICLLIMGSFIPWIYYRFRCNLWLRIFYISTSTTLGFFIVGKCLSKNFFSPSYRYMRVFVFTGFAFSGFVPVFHLLYMDDWNIIIGPGTPYIITGSILYILGAGFYALRIPEKLVPGEYDMWFNSHQIFHILVVTAALLDYKGLIGVYEETSNTECE